MNKLYKKLGAIRAKLALTDHDVVVTRYKNIFGVNPDLKNPRTFNEKILWIILNYRNPLYEVCADKVNVRDYVKLKGLDQYLTKLYAVYEAVGDIDFDLLPNKFVIKTTHSYSGVCVVTDKNNVDYEQIKKTLTRSFSKNLYESTREWQYKNLTPRIMAEEYIEPEEGKPLLDYKFYCFNGEPRFIHVSSDIAKGGSYEMDFYDISWRHLDARREGRTISNGIAKPAELNEMLHIAQILSEEFPHVRVDLYNVRGKIYIGELTFTTAAGTGKFTDSKWDYELGKYFTLPKSGSEIIAERTKK